MQWTYLWGTGRHRTKTRWHRNSIWTDGRSNVLVRHEGNWRRVTLQSLVHRLVEILAVHLPVNPWAMPLNMALIMSLVVHLVMPVALPVTVWYAEAGLHAHILTRMRLVALRLCLRRHQGRNLWWLLEGFTEILTNLTFLFLYHVVSCWILQFCLNLQRKF